VVSAIEKEGNYNIAIMHCILNYPTKYEDCNLNMIRGLRTSFPHHIIGYSDHAEPDKNMLVLTSAVLLGAKVVEKHFTLDKSLPGNDHYHSMDPEDLRRFVKNVELLKKMLGKKKKEPLESELPAKRFARRSVVAKTFIPKGTKITAKMVSLKRPGIGISPKDLDLVLKMRAAKDIDEDDIIAWRHLK